MRLNIRIPTISMVYWLNKFDMAPEIHSMLILTNGCLIRINHANISVKGLICYTKAKNIAPGKNIGPPAAADGPSKNYF